RPPRSTLFPYTTLLRSGFFNNDNPIVLEFGCGKGEYTVALAKGNPNINYIGIDIKGARFWRGAKTAVEENLSNVAFIRTQIELIEYLFSFEEVREIWITLDRKSTRLNSSHVKISYAVF